MRDELGRFMKGNVMKHSAETKRKIGERGKGRVPWNKGLQGNEYLSHFENGHPKGMSGKTPWNKDKKMSKEACLKMSEAKQGKPTWNKGKKCPQLAGPNNPFWSGGRHKHSQGYINVYQPGHPRAKSRNYVFEQILVMEEHIGRYLRPEEIVHHLDLDKTNNNIENLYLFINESKHQTYHIFLQNLVRGLSNQI